MSEIEINTATNEKSSHLSVDDAKFINEKCSSLENFTSNSNIIIGIKDVNSIHVGCSPEYAKIIGVADHKDLKGKTDHEIPCTGVAEFANQYKSEDEMVVGQGGETVNIKTLNIHNYKDGFKARIFNKTPLINPYTQSVLGLMFTAHDAMLNNFLDILPNYYKMFGCLDSFKDRLNPSIELNEYEQEICYLLVLKWDFAQITTFMDKFRPLDKPRTVDAIRKKKNYICNKLKLPNEYTSTLIEYLISKDFQHSIPKLFLDRLLGSTIIEKNS